MIVKFFCGVAVFRAPQSPPLDSIKKTFFQKFKLLNSGCGLSGVVYGIFKTTILLKKILRERDSSIKF